MMMLFIEFSRFEIMVNVVMAAFAQTDKVVQLFDCDPLRRAWHHFLRVREMMDLFDVSMPTTFADVVAAFDHAPAFVSPR